MTGDLCPKECNHETFHYCGQSGTHCDKHCVCSCQQCVEEQEGAILMSGGKDTGGRILSGPVVLSNESSLQKKYTFHGYCPKCKWRGSQTEQYEVTNIEQDSPSDEDYDIMWHGASALLEQMHEDSSTECPGTIHVS